MLRKNLRFLLFIAIAATISSCAAYKRDRCYLAETRYLTMKSIFETTGSYERVAQAMEDEGWSHCEINTLRYRLRKDLALEGPEFDELFAANEPSRKEIDYNPGRVEKVPPAGY